MLSSEKRSFDDCGYLIRESVISKKAINALHEEIAEIVGLVAQKKVSASEFDRAYVEYCLNDSNKKSTVYETIKQLPAFQQIWTDSTILETARHLLGSTSLGYAWHGMGIRINAPFDTVHRLDWHQEYPGQLRSKNGLVVWIPIVPMSINLGPVEVLSGSHKAGTKKVRKIPPKIPGRKYALEILDLDQELGKCDLVSPCLAPGDALFLDFHSIHRSGANTSNRCLWSIQFRIFDFLEQTGVRNGWPGSYMAGIDFESIHPELVGE